MKKAILLTILLCPICHIGAKNYVFDVTSTGQYDLFDQTFRLHPADSALAVDSNYAAYETCVASYLLFNGAIEVTNSDTAEMDVQIEVKDHTVALRAFLSLSENTQIQLWETTVAANHTTTPIDSLFPYMLYAIRHYMGQDIDHHVVIILPDEAQADVLFRWIATGTVRTNNTYGFPGYQEKGAYAADCYLHLAAVQRNTDATRILLDYRSDIPCKLSKETYIEYDFHRLYIRSIKGQGVKINRNLPEHIGYVLLEFDAIPQHIETIDLRDGRKKSPLLWSGIQL